MRNVRSNLVFQCKPKNPESKPIQHYTRYQNVKTNFGIGTVRHLQNSSSPADRRWICKRCYAMVTRNQFDPSSLLKCGLQDKNVSSSLTTGSRGQTRDVSVGILAAKCPV
eukprot:scaffold4262_cov169-Amphora_coffeaeformis.AAC.14